MISKVLLCGPRSEDLVNDDHYLCTFIAVFRKDSPVSRLVGQVREKNGELFLETPGVTITDADVVNKILLVVQHNRNNIEEEKLPTFEKAHEETEAHLKNKLTVDEVCEIAE